jgi:hypothetical protein
LLQNHEVSFTGENLVTGERYGECGEQKGKINEKLEKERSGCGK